MVSDLPPLPLAPAPPLALLLVTHTSHPLPPNLPSRAVRPISCLPNPKGRVFPPQSSSYVIFFLWFHMFFLCFHDCSPQAKKKGRIPHSLLRNILPMVPCPKLKGRIPPEASAVQNSRLESSGKSGLSRLFFTPRSEARQLSG